VQGSLWTCSICTRKKNNRNLASEEVIFAKVRKGNVLILYILFHGITLRVPLRGYYYKYTIYIIKYKRKIKDQKWKFFKRQLLT
jgi:hypothetical protein